MSVESSLTRLEAQEVYRRLEAVGTRIGTLSEQLVRIEERQEAALERSLGLSSKLDVLTNKLDRYVEKEDLLPFMQRVESVESTQTWMVRSLLIGAASVLGGLYAGAKKIGLA